MKAEEIRNLSVGTKVRGKLGPGVIAISPKYGKGVKLDDYDYLFDEDIHAFADRSDETIEEMVEEVIKT